MSIPLNSASAAHSATLRQQLRSGMSVSVQGVYMQPSSDLVQFRQSTIEWRPDIGDPIDGAPNGPHLILIDTPPTTPMSSAARSSTATPPPLMDRLHQDANELMQLATPALSAVRSLGASTSSDHWNESRPLSPATTPSSANESTNQVHVREVTYAYRHNPYSFRAFQRVGVSENHQEVVLMLGAEGEPKIAHAVRTDVLLKPAHPPIDLRRREIIADKKSNALPAAPASPVTPKKSSPNDEAASEPALAENGKATKPATNAAAAQSRKLFKKAVEASGMKIKDPLYDIRVLLEDPTWGRKPSIAVAAAFPSSDTAPIACGNTTMTGLPNADGHRVAAALLDHFVRQGVIKGTFTFATTERRTDRFNTGACHINFDDIADAKRLQATLRSDLIFASFRAGGCVVGHAAD